MTSLQMRYQGCLLGLAVGDALGTTLEFMPPGSFTPITDMTGGGPFRLKPGQWTDDTSMALCLAPVPLFFAGDPRKTIEKSGESSRTTHGASAAIDACRYFLALILRRNQRPRQGNPPVRSLYARFRLLAGTPPCSGNRRNCRRILQTEEPAGHPVNRLCCALPGGCSLGLPSRRIFRTRSPDGSQPRR
jgi:hypothetical protein